MSAPPKRPASGIAIYSTPAKKSANEPGKMQVVFTTRDTDAWVSVDVKDAEGFFPGNPNWTSCVKTLREVKKSGGIAEFSKQDMAGDAAKKHLHDAFYPATWGNASAEWCFTMPASDFVPAIKSRFDDENAANIGSYKYKINTGKAAKPTEINTLDEYLTAIKQIEQRIADDAAVDQLAEDASKAEDVDNLKKILDRVAELEGRVAALEQAKNE